MTSQAVLTHHDHDHTTKGHFTMYMQEEALARSRMHEAEQAARQYRLARQLTAGRAWRRLARWSSQRADRAAQL